MVQNRSKVLRGLLFTLYNLRVKNVQELLPGGVCRLTDQAGFFVSKALTSSRVSFEYFATFSYGIPSASISKAHSMFRSRTVSFLISSIALHAVANSCCVLFSGIGSPAFFFQEHSTIIPSFLQANAICKFYGIIKVSPSARTPLLQKQNPRTERFPILCGGMLALWFPSGHKSILYSEQIRHCHEPSKRCSGQQSYH